MWIQLKKSQDLIKKCFRGNLYIEYTAVVVLRPSLFCSSTEEEWEHGVLSGMMHESA